MPRLFTYIIPYDDGAAPNPFRGMCSLAICKPAIRRVAEPGDWVAGVGSKKAPSGDLSGRLVYAMKVEEIKTLQEYDQLASTRWPHRIPNVTSLDLSERLGDCIYDYSKRDQKGNPAQRLGVHGSGDGPKDCSGENVLISKHFYYFGSRAIRLPTALLPICPITRGHRSTANGPYVDQFEIWLRSLNIMPGQMYGWPDLIIDWTDIQACGPCSVHNMDDEETEETC